MDKISFDFKGRTAIVTGGAQGFGLDITKRLIRSGASVIIWDNDQKMVEKAIEDIKSPNLSFNIVDISNYSKVEECVQEITKQKNIDILINNAGELLRAPVVPLSEVELHPPHVTRFSNGRMTDEEWESVINTNLNSVFYCCRAVAPYMISRRYGKIVNISSNNASQAFPLVSAYNASKAAVNMLTKVLALEWAESNILVNAIGPGDYNTKMTEPTWIDPAARKKHLDGIPLGREGSLRELGILAAYLSSPATDYMTGQVIYMDGGLTAKNL